MVGLFCIQNDRTRSADPVATFASPTTTTATHCPYCAFQCGVRVGAVDGAMAIAGDTEFPVNRGALCIKGFTATETLDHPERLRSPLVRNRAGVLAPASWDEALDRIAAGIRATQASHGADAV